MTEIYALQTATMVGCALEDDAQWFFELHTTHATHKSALTAMVHTFDEIRDEDLAAMQAEWPQDCYTEDDYAIRLIHTTDTQSAHELVRRNGTDMIPLSQMVITRSEVFEVA